MRFLLLFILSFSLQVYANLCDPEFQPDMNEISFGGEGRFLKSKDPANFMQEYQSFKRMTASGDILGIQTWINSPEKAAFAYQVIGTKNSHIMSQVMKDHPHFKNTIPVKNSQGEVVTFSFEKETYSEVSPLYFKPKNMTMDEWEALGYNAQVQLIKDSRVNFTEKFEKSELSYNYLGKPTLEFTKTGTMVELKHHSFEITPDKIMEEIKQIADDVKETHSFHVHVVFKMPEARLEQYRESFLRWYQHVDDYVLLKGFEEGMHPAAYTEMSSYQDLLEQFQFSETSILHKFRSVGLRSGIYGKSENGLIPLGLEFRDSTRVIKNYEAYIKQAGKSVGDAIWEKNPKNALEANILDFTKTKKHEELINKAVEEFKLDKFILEEIVLADQEAILPFYEFENYKYMNYKSGALEGANAEVALRIKNARAAYAKEIDHLINEIKSYKASGKEYNFDEVSLVVRMEVAGWAKQAKASELLKNF
ncbi:MAG: hypothetical protein ACOYL6_14750 [Bacteriovoracaceae bacterium]